MTALTLSPSQLRSSIFLDESIAVDEAAIKAINLINELSSGTNKDEKINPDEMYQQLDIARNDIMLAWKRLEQATQVIEQQQQQQQNETKSTNTTTTAVDLRPAFMDMITDAFGDVLDNLRQSEEVDVTILVDCLQSGLEIMSGDVTINEDDFEWMDDYDDNVIETNVDNDDNDNNNDDDIEEEEEEEEEVKGAEEEEKHVVLAEDK